MCGIIKSSSSYKRFTLVRVEVDLETIPGILDVKQEFTVDVGVYCRTPFITVCNLAQLIHQQACFRKETREPGGILCEEHAKLHPDTNPSLGAVGQ